MGNWEAPGPPRMPTPSAPKTRRCTRDGVHAVQRPPPYGPRRRAQTAPSRRGGVHRRLAWAGDQLHARGEIRRTQHRDRSNGRWVHRGRVNEKAAITTGDGRAGVPVSVGRQEASCDQQVTAGISQVPARVQEHFPSRRGTQGAQATRNAPVRSSLLPGVSYQRERKRGQAPGTEPVPLFAGRQPFSVTPTVTMSLNRATDSSAAQAMARKASTRKTGSLNVQL